MTLVSAESGLTGRGRGTYTLKARAVWNDRHLGPSGNSSVVECDLAKVEVAGSNPVSRSKRLETSGKWKVESGKQGWRVFSCLQLFTCHLPLFFRARYPSGKGEVCKTFTRGFDSHPRLQFLQQLSLDNPYSSGLLNFTANLLNSLWFLGAVPRRSTTQNEGGQLGPHAD